MKKLDETMLILLTTLFSIIYFAVMKPLSIEPLTTTNCIIMGTFTLLYTAWMVVAFDMAIRVDKK